jgi:hypothetical protein
MKRRDFLLTTSIGIAAISIPSYYYYFGNASYDSLLGEPQSLSLIWDTETIESVGILYREKFHEESREKSLARLLTKEIPAGNSDLASAIDRIIVEDFKTGNTVEIDGWILSVTEARQCALYSINQSK